MAGRIPDHGRQPADPHGIAVAHGLVHARHLAGGFRRRDDAAAEPRLEGLDALHVIGMAMGDEDIAETPAGLGERRHDRFLLGRIDGRAGAGLRVVDQGADIVV